ncbi:Rne/Rng family ribonuclease [Cytobacillus sp. NCCP-133]|uniref:Rne/Rng family ribonuclease n=1 Tax=Cytobacillus sp. NCCP-133 TaxID=766848 RepID=UPI00222E9A61|nr:Rne/Rng family ribonuclease [Cytobacillus sp. NCCP-133]GLB58361.1 ribonuclease E [Cytobacillus sp. NCCP-133]
MDRLVVNYVSRERRAACIINGKVEKLFIDQPKQQSTVGNIYLGTVAKVMPGLNAAFVEIGEEQSGFLHRDKLASYAGSGEERQFKDKRSISSYVHQGEKILVQVEKEATGTKGPRLSGLIEFPGDSIIYLPEGRYVAVSKKIDHPAAREKWRQLGYLIKEEREGLIFRTSCENKQEHEIREELDKLRHDYNSLLRSAKALKKPGKVFEADSFVEDILEEMKKMAAGEVIVDDLNVKRMLQQKSSIPIHLYNGKENIFAAHKIEAEIEKALKRIVWIENGAYLIFDEAEALTVIDVNTGKYTGKHDRRETVLKTNEWAAEEAARQIRLRDIGGMILIDFIDMKEEGDRKQILSKMESALKKDERRTNLIGFTPLGILQLTRKKTKPAITESLTKRCQVCEGAGWVLSAETIAFRMERELWELRGREHEAVWVEASKEVGEVFSGENSIHKKRIEDSIGMKVIFTFREDCKPFYEIRQLGQAKDLKAKAGRG